MSGETPRKKTEYREEKEGKTMNKKQNVTITMETELWQKIRCQSAQYGISASAMISMVMGMHCLQTDALLANLARATPKELAEFKNELEKGVMKWQVQE